MRKTTRRIFLQDVLAAGGSFLLFQQGLFGKERLKDPKETGEYPSYLKLYKSGELSRRVEVLYSHYENCTLCPRDCRVNRTQEELGKCQASSKVKISNAFPHFGEESPLVGENGSGTIFFSNCGLRCVYCQNYDISIEGDGTEISDERLAETMLRIQAFGCHNINFVTPTHYLPSIVNALNIAVPKGLHIPLVYNTSGYEKPDMLRLLDDVIDIYLPDFKYMDPGYAALYSSEAFNYPHYARMAFKEMHRQVGVFQYGPRRIARRGLMIRHLILPNGKSDTKDVLRFISKEISKDSYVNLMRQYRPEYKAREYPKIARRISSTEYRNALNWAEEFGLKRLTR